MVRLNTFKIIYFLFIGIYPMLFSASSGGENLDIGWSDLSNLIDVSKKWQVLSSGSKINFRSLYETMGNDFLDVPFIGMIRFNSILFHGDSHALPDGMPWGPGWVATTEFIPLVVIDGHISSGPGYLWTYKTLDIPMVYFYRETDWHYKDKLVKVINAGTRENETVVIRVKTPEEEFKQDDRIAKIYCGVNASGPSSNLPSRQYAPAFGKGYIRPNGDRDDWEGRDWPFEMVLCDPKPDNLVHATSKTFTTEEEVQAEMKYASTTRLDNLTIVPMLFSAIVKEDASNIMHAAILEDRSISFTANIISAHIKGKQCFSLAVTCLLKHLQVQQPYSMTADQIDDHNKLILHLSQIILTSKHSSHDCDSDTLPKICTKGI